MRATLLWMVGFGLWGMSSLVQGADVSSNFLAPELNVDGTFLWDDFQAALGFPGPHPAIAAGTGSAQLQATPGGLITASGNLYAFTATPTLTFAINGAAANEALTDLRLQVATTQLLTSSIFPTAPSQFVSRGALSQMNFGGSPVDVHYYDVRWNGLSPASTISVTMGPAEIHSVLGGARLDYTNISAIPEPTSGLLSLAVLSATLWIRKRNS